MLLCRVQIAFICGDHPDGAFWTKTGHLGPSGDLFRGKKGQIEDLLRPQKRFTGSYNGLLVTPRGAPKVWKWVSDAYPVNMGQLDHHVGFLNQIWCPTRLLEGQKVPYRGQTDPP